MQNYIDNKTIHRILLETSNPGRYAGGEYGILSRKDINPDTLKTAVSYPDLYEIGMSNNAVKILYNIINRIDNVICDRVFSPANDFEEKLKQNSVPLFTIENRIPLHSLDILGFSFGYELTATNMLNILELGRIPVLNSDRDISHPVIIAGGPGTTNPAPYGAFIDAFFIGEAEEEIELLMKKASLLKQKGAERDDILELFTENPHVWSAGKKSRVKRAVFNSFSNSNSRFNLTHMPVPAVKTAQDHGVVEIMRGCPNGCRFCHAGFLYRPKREKNPSVIAGEVDDIVYSCGYREITLSSLSSGDYSHIVDLFRYLNKRYSGKGISFSLPSLKIDTFTLPLLSEISEVRKSGLTFAVETPDLLWQKSINKQVDPDNVINIVNEAKKAGWRSAKFYFMIGLPPAENTEEETDSIINFIFKIYGQTGININLNIGTFVPKPHTPYQRAGQLEEGKALEQIYRIKNSLKGKNIKLGYHSPFMSYIEGIFSRGDSRAGDLLLSAYSRGARFDAWEEHFRRDIWREAIAEQPWDVEHETCRERAIDEKLPWDNITLGISHNYLEKENSRSMLHELTAPCTYSCSQNCGVCNSSTTLHETEMIQEDKNTAIESALQKRREEKYLAVFSFEKKESHIYTGHLDIMRLFERAFQRSRLPVVFTEGFNPKPRLQFAHPLSLGIASEDEAASIELYIDPGKTDITDTTDITYKTLFMESLNTALPDSIKVKEAVFRKIIPGSKMPSLMSLYSGSRYLLYSENNQELYSLLSEYIIDNNLKHYVMVEKKDNQIDIVIKKADKSKNLLKILKEASGKENPLAFIDAVRVKTFASDSMESYISYFSRL